MRRKTAWLVYNSWIISDKFDALFRHIYASMVAQGVDCEMVKHEELVIVQKTHGADMIGKYKNQRPDFILFWDKDVRLAKQLESLGFPVFNSASSIELCEFKDTTQFFLTQHGIPMPKTIFNPRVAHGHTIKNHQFYDEVIDYLGLPLVMKGSEGSFGATVDLVRSKEELLQLTTRWQYTPHLYQAFIHHSQSRDLRLQVVGNQVVAAIKRTSENDFRANLTNGGKAVHYTPSQEEVELAIKATQLVGATFTGVDLLFGEDGPILCELNANAHIMNLMDCTGIDVAPIIIDEILGHL